MIFFLSFKEIQFHNVIIVVLCAFKFFVFHNKIYDYSVCLRYKTKNKTKRRYYLRFYKLLISLKPVDTGFVFMELYL